MKRRSQPKAKHTANSPYTKHNKKPHWYGPHVQAVYQACGKQSQYAEGGKQ